MRGNKLFFLRQDMDFGRKIKDFLSERVPLHRRFPPDFPIPANIGHPTEIVVGPDGNLWFIVSDNNIIGRLSLKGSVTLFPLPTNDAPFEIVVGPDGNLWFTESSNEIGRISTAGSITQFSLPTSNSNPEYIVARSDGNLWFTELGGNKIGRISTTGSLAEFPIPTSNSNPFDIIFGPDNNLWFIERNDKLARSTFG